MHLTDPGKEKLWSKVVYSWIIRTIEDFDGRGWGGVYLDDTTRDDFKNQYRTKGGNFIRPESTIVTSAPGAPWDIQALQDGTGGKAHITGFHVEFKDGGTSQDRLRGLDRDGGKREEWFPQKRYSD